MAIRKKEMEMVPEEQEDENKKMIGQAEEQMEGEVPEHTHPEIDQLLVKIQELEQRLADKEMDNQDYEEGCNTKKEELKDDPEREPDNVYTKKVNTENPEKLKTRKPIKMKAHEST